MIHIVKAQERHFSDMGWLKTFWLFSFSDYYDPTNVRHGQLRVFNDDVVEGDSGFGTHPHEEMEIISIVLSGEMVHQDSMGNEIIVRAGDVQRMTAGSGLYHSEWNKSKSPVHFYQIWVLPDEMGLTPSYDQKHFESGFWQNRLALIASGDASDDAVSLNADGAVYRGWFDKGVQASHDLIDGRHQFIYVMKGRLEINGHLLEAGDQGRVSSENQLQLHTSEEAEILLVDTR